MSVHDLKRWRAGHKFKLVKPRPRIEVNGGLFFMQGKKNNVKKRRDREAESKVKMKIVYSVKNELEKDPNILMVAITGSLAMKNAPEAGDIDLMVVVRRGRLWQTRIKTLIRLMVAKHSVRRAREKHQANKFCFNLWMDESDMQIEAGMRNPYTAHELAQIVPLINKETVYQELLWKNKWILDYWPDAVDIAETARHATIETGAISRFFELVSYGLQMLYMRRKITRETVTGTRAFFHPMDWSRRVQVELRRRGVGFL